MIFLDANVFYWYLGREKLFSQSSTPKHNVEALNLFLESRKDKSLPASAFMEMIVHFRDNPSALVKILRFREEKSIKIINNFREYCFTPDELTYLHLTENGALLRQYAYKLLDKKIAVEVKHAYVFLQIVSLLYADYYLKSHNSLEGEIRENVLLYLGRDISNSLRKDFSSQLTSALQTGYADNNRSQQALKKKYIELLVQNCVMFQMIIDATVKFLEEEKDLYAAMCRSAHDARNNGFTDNGIMKVIVAALDKDSAFLKFAENEISEIFIRKGYSKHQADYLKLMLEAWLERGQKLIKNDIFDMLCVGVLDKQEKSPQLNALFDQSSYLISFDETMMKFICNDSRNAQLINRFMIQ